MAEMVPWMFTSPWTSTLPLAEMEEPPWLLSTLRAKQMAHSVVKVPAPLAKLVAVTAGEGKAVLGAT